MSLVGLSYNPGNGSSSLLSSKFESNPTVIIRVQCP